MSPTLGSHALMLVAWRSPSIGSSLLLYWQRLVDSRRTTLPSNRQTLPPPSPLLKDPIRKKPKNKQSYLQTPSTLPPPLSRTACETRLGSLVPQSIFIYLESPPRGKSDSTHCDGGINPIIHALISRLLYLHAHPTCPQGFTLPELLTSTLGNTPSHVLTTIASAALNIGIRTLPLLQHNRARPDYNGFSAGGSSRQDEPRVSY